MIFNFYGFVYFLAFLFFYFFLYKKTSLKDKDLYFILNITFLILFARIFHVLSELSYYLNHPLQIFQIWKGGLAFYGGLFGVILANLIYLKITKDDKQKVISFLETFIIYVPIFIFLGRIANYFNHEHPGVFPLLPQPIFEAIMHGLIPFVVLLFVKKNRVLWFLIVYTISRSITEIFRFYFGIKLYHLIIILAFLFSVYILNELYKSN
jgi:phosphatidylglycerol:prolipoprotein diacylglycerol transferase